MKTYAGIDPSITNTGVVLLDERGRTLATYNSKTGCRKKDYASDILFYRSRADEIISFIRERSADGLSAACMKTIRSTPCIERILLPSTAAF